MTPLAIAAVLFGAPLAALLIAARFAPLGFEDATGFHLATPSPRHPDRENAGEDQREGQGFRAIHRSVSK